MQARQSRVVELKDDTKVPLYPLLLKDGNWRSIRILLQWYIERDQLRRSWFEAVLVEDGTVRLELLHAIRVLRDDKAKNWGVQKDWVLYATRRYRVKRGVSVEAMKNVNRFDCVEVKFTGFDQLFLYRVLGIFCFVKELPSGEEQRMVMLLVTLMVDVEKKGPLKFCPLRYVKHNITPADGLQLDLIPFDCVVRPAFVFHDPDKKPLYQEEGMSRQSMGENRMWAMTMNMWMKARSGFRQSVEEMKRFFAEDNSAVVLNVEDNAPPENYDDRIVPFVIGQDQIGAIVERMRVNEDIELEVNADNDEVVEAVALGYLDNENNSDDEDNDVNVLEVAVELPEGNGVGN